MAKLSPPKLCLIGELESLKAELLSMKSGMVMCLDRVDAVIDSVKNSDDESYFVEPTIGASDEAVKVPANQNGNLVKWLCLFQIVIVICNESIKAQA